MVLPLKSETLLGDLANNLYLFAPETETRDGPATMNQDKMELTSPWESVATITAPTSVTPATPAALQNFVSNFNPLLMLFVEST